MPQQEVLILNAFRLLSLSNLLSLAGDLTLASRFKSLDSQVDILILVDYFIICINFSVKVHLVLLVTERFHVQTSAARLILTHVHS